MKDGKKNRRFPGWYRGGIVCLGFLMLVLAGTESLAAKEGRVKAQMANVRSEADKNSQQVAQLPQGSTFTVTEEVSDGSGFTWYHVVFAVDGNQQTGWIRSDTSEITAEDVPDIPAEGGEEGGEGQIAMGPVINGITIQEPESLPEATENLSAGQAFIGEQSFSAMVVDPSLTGQQELYLVYGSDASGNGAWYFYDPAQGTLQRDMGQFSGGSDALLKALQEENEELQKGQDGSLSIRNYIIVGLGVACLILFVLVVMLAVKLSRIEYVDDEDDEEDREDIYEDDEDQGEEPIWMSAVHAKQEEKNASKEKKKKRSFFGRGGDDEEEEEDLDSLEEEDPSFDDMEEEDILAAVLKKKGPREKSGDSAVAEKDMTGVEKEGRRAGERAGAAGARRPAESTSTPSGTRPEGGAAGRPAGARPEGGATGRPMGARPEGEIGRASCRERVWSRV